MLAPPQELNKGRIIIGTNAVGLDEPCWGLHEFNERTPDSRGIHRYQVFKVLRDGKLVEFRRDLGPAEKFKITQEIVAPGGIPLAFDAHGRMTRGEAVETVGRLIDAADDVREGPASVHEKPVPYDLIGAYRTLPDKRKKRRKALSTFGPGGVTIR